MHIGRPGNVPHLVGDLLRDHIVARHVHSDDLYIDRRGQSEIQNLGHDIGGLKKEFHSRKASRQYFAQTPRKLRRRYMVLWIERN